MNLSLYGLTAGATMVLSPILAIVLPNAVMPPFPQTAAGIAAHFLLILLALDLSYYFLHRLAHAWTGLWRLHAIHHTDLDLDVTTSLRHHPAEGLVFAALVGIAGALLGASAAEIATYALLSYGVQLVAHTDLGLPSRVDAKLARILVTPGFHCLHHSQDEREANSNFGQVFAFWDRLFGTALAVREDGPAAYGVTRYLNPRHQQLGWILLQPVLPTATVNR